MAALTIKDKNSNPTSVLYDANQKTMAVFLPQDVILFEILTKVPTKSVIRFMCVSKQWNSFLMSDRFKQMHNRNLRKDPHLKDQKLFFFSEKTATFFTIDCESLPKKAPCSRPLPQFEAYRPDYMSCILTSYHGLVCFGIRKCNDCRYSDIILWNPLTTEYKRLSKPANPDYMECYRSFESRYGLYYSSCEDDYKLLAVTDQSGNVYIYSLKVDSWRKLNKKAPKKIGWSWRRGFCLSENIYFLCHNIAQGSIRFDTTAERFHKIETPPEYDNTHKLHTATITVHRGSIHFCVKYDIGRYDIARYDFTCIKLWKLSVDGDIWSKVVTYQLMPNYDIRCLSPVHLMNNGNWLMRDYSYAESHIFQVDLKKKKYTKEKDGHESKGKNQSKGNFHDEYELYSSNVSVGYPEEVFYTETFVSPNQYMK